MILVQSKLTLSCCSVWQRLPSTRTYVRSRPVVENPPSECGEGGSARTFGRHAQSGKDQLWNLGKLSCARLDFTQIIDQRASHRPALRFIVT